MTDQQFSRREFMRTIVIGAASLVVLPAVANAAATTYIDLGPEKQFDAGWTRVVLPVKYNQEVIFVRKATAPAKGSPAYQAVSARCTHRGCVVNYEADQHQFECPCHHGKFNDDAVNVSGPPRTPLNALSVKIDGHAHVLVTPPAVANSD